MSWLASGARRAPRLKLLAALCLFVVIAYLGLPFGIQSSDRPDALTTLPSGQPDPKSPQPLMFLDEAEQTDLTEAVDLELNIEALRRGETLWLPVGPDGQLVEFSNYETTKDRNSTSFIGALTLGGVELPTTITTSERSIFATIPTAEGVIEGRGSPDNIAFQKRPAFRDLIDLNHFEEESTDVHRASEGTCLNC
jgi:hypothetical protein